MKSLLFFLLDMWCSAVDAAMHVFDDEPDDSGQSSTTDLTEETR